MKILFTRFPLESAYGGAERQTLSLMKSLSERHHAVAFLGSCPVLLKEMRALNLPVAKLHIGNPPVSKWNALSFVWRGKKMQKKLESALETFHGLDAIVMLSLSEKILLTPLALRKGIKVFWLEHDPVGNWLTKNPWKKDLTELSSSITTIVVSDLSKKLYEELGFASQNIIAIPNGVDENRFAAFTHVPVEKENLHLGCIARLAEEKGVDVLLEAVRDIPTVSLTIVGTGREEGCIKKLIAEIHENEKVTPPRIRLFPSMDHLSDFYKSIDVLVLPSRSHDPFGLVVAEAMMQGIPTLITDACGIAGYMENNVHTIIVNANSSTEIKLGIQTLSNLKTRQRLSQEGLAYAKKSFTLKGMADKYEAVLSSKS